MKKVIIDTDLMTDIDDQFALVYALTADCFDIQAITLCPFKKKEKAQTIFDGMIDSFFEAKRICRLTKNSTRKVFKGSLGFVDSGYTKKSDAVNKIIEIAMKNRKTYIACLGTLTNIALAIKYQPKIIKKIELVWLGTKSVLMDKFNDTNYNDDKKAFEQVIKSGVKMTVIPSFIGKFNATSIYEIKEHVAINPVGRHLYRLIDKSYNKKENRGLKYIYDISAIAYLKDKNLFRAKSIPVNYLLKEQKKVKEDMMVNYVYDGSSNNSVWLDFLKTIKNAPNDVFKSKMFFISDTHFCQKDKIRNKEFEYTSSEQTDHEFVKRWNSIVGENDTVYHLGDFGKYETIKMLNGKVVLVCGNYEKDEYKDNFPKFRRRLKRLGFKEVYEKNYVLEEKYFGRPINLVHKPTDTRKDMFNLFGHVHSLKAVMNNGFNVCLEYHGYKPVSQEVVKSQMEFMLTEADQDVVYD